MVRTSFCAVGVGVFMFAGMAFLPHPRAMAQLGGAPPEPTPTPLAFYSDSGSGIDTCSSPSSWTYAVDITPAGSAATDNSTYWTNGTYATSAGGGAYSCTAVLTLTNTTSVTEIGSFACHPELSGTSFATGHVASSSVSDSGTGSWSNSTATQNPYNAAPDGDAGIDNFQTNIPESPNGIWQSNGWFVSFSGSAG